MKIPAHRLIGLLAALVLGSGLPSALAEEDVETRWGVVHLDGQKAGLIRWQRSRVQEGEATLVQTVYELVLTVFRMGAEVTTRERLLLMETEEGKPVRFTLTMREGDDLSESSGEIRDGKIIIVDAMRGVERETTSDWDPETLGIYGLESLVRKEGRDKGTTYTARVFSPNLPPDVTLRFTVAGEETVDILGEKATLTRIDVTLDGDPEVMQTVWVDDDHRPRKETSEVEGVERIEYWVSKEQALEGDAVYRPKPRVRGNLYDNPRLGITFQKPDDWTFRRGEAETLVEIVPPGEGSGIEVRAVETEEGADPEKILEAIAGAGTIEEKRERSIAEHRGIDVALRSGRCVLIRPGPCCAPPYGSVAFVFLLEEVTEESREALDQILETVGIHVAAGTPEGLAPRRGRLPGGPMILGGHSMAVNSVAFGPDGKTLVSGSMDKTVKVWDLETGLERHSRDRTDWIWGVALSPDGKIVAAASRDKTVVLWEVQTGAEVRKLESHTRGVRAVAFAPEGRTLLSGGADATARLWDLDTGEEIRVFEGHATVVESVAFGPDGKIVATGSLDRTARIWDVAAGREIRTLTGHSHWVRSVAFSPDGKILATGSNDKTVKLWDVATGEEMRTLGEQPHFVQTVAFSPDGKTLASGGFDQFVRLWDVATGEQVQVLTGPEGGVRSVAFSPDGKVVAAGSDDARITLWTH